MRATVRALLAVAAAVGVAWLVRSRVADALTWRYAQRPTGRGARVLYGARRPEYDGVETMLEALALRAGDRLVEIGPGGGFVVEAALSQCASVTAVDHSPQMLELTATRNRAAVEAGRVHLVEADAVALPLAPGAFDVAATNDVLLVVGDPEALLAELARVLSPGGRVVVQTRSPQARAAMRAVGLGWMARRLRFYEDDQLVEMLRHAGFEHVHVGRDPRTSTQQAVATRVLQTAPVKSPSASRT